MNLWLTDTDFDPKSDGAQVLATIGGTTFGNVKVPEPSSVLLLRSGLLGLALTLRRRRSLVTHA